MRRHIIIKPEVGPASLFPSTAPAVVSSAVRQTAKMHLQSASPKSVLYQVSFWALCLRAKNLASVQVLVDFKHACASEQLPQQHSITCTAQDARFFELLCAFFRALLRRAAPKNRTWRHNSRQHFDSPRIPLPQGQPACFNARLHRKHDNQELNHFCARPYTAAHFCGTSTQTSGHLSSRQQGERGTADKRWQR